MEIDEINLQDELTSGFLVKYLNGEISFHEWLQLQSDGGNTEENVVGDEMGPNELYDVNMVDGAQEIVAPDDDGVLYKTYILYRPVNSPGATGRLPVLTFFSRYQDIFARLLVLTVMRNGIFSRFKYLARNSNRVKITRVQAETYSMNYKCSAF
jgi:hypothetical protein